MRRFAVLWIFSGCLLAQEQTGTIEGQVTDSSGAAMAGVAGSVTGSTLWVAREARLTSQAGRYRLAFLPVGAYEVKFEHAGFATRINQDVRVAADATFTLNATLSPSTLTTSVDVVSASPMIETAASDVTFSFNKDILDKVPNARDPWAIMNQAPELCRTRSMLEERKRGNQPAFRGARYRSNASDIHVQRCQRDRQHG